MTTDKRVEREMRNGILSETEYRPEIASNY